MLNNELGTVTNIKDKNNRKNVTDAIKSTLEKLKLYKKCPENGLAVFCGWGSRHWV